MSSSDITESVTESTADISPPSYRPAMAWVITGMLVIFIAINWADKALFGLIAQPVAEELGLSSTQVGMLGSAFFFLFSITGLTVGFIADRVKVKWVLFTLAALWSVAQLPVLVSASVATLLFNRIALGAAEGPASAMANVGAFQWFPKEKRALPSAWLTSGGSIAKILVAPLLVLLIAAYGWRSAFLTLAALGLVWCVAWLLISKEGPYATRNHLPVGYEAAPDSAPANRVPFRTIARSGTFIGASIGAFAMYAMTSVVLTWLPSYFEVGLGYSRVQSGAMFGLPSIFSMVAMIVVSWFTDRQLARGATSRGMRALVAAGALIVGGLLLAALPLVGGQLWPVVLLSCGYGTVAVSIPLLFASISQIVPATQQAGALGVFVAFYSVAGLVAPALTGMIVDSAETPGAGYALAFQIIGIAAMIAGLAVAFLMHPERDAARIVPMPVRH